MTFLLEKQSGRINYISWVLSGTSRIFVSNEHIYIFFMTHSHKTPVRLVLIINIVIMGICNAQTCPTRDCSGFKISVYHD